MKINNKFKSLVKHGINPSTLKKLTEGQINMMYNRLKEAVTTQTLPPMKLTKVTPDTAKSTGVNVGNVDVQTDSAGNVLIKSPLTSGKSDIKNKNKILPDTEMKEEMNFLKGKDKKEVKEKSVSKQQQKFFGVVRGMQKGDIPKKGKAGKAAEEMSKKDVKDFASTKHKNLPKKKETKESYTKGLQNAYANMLQSNLSKTVNPQFPSFDSSDSSIQENIEKMINKHITPKISKKDFLKYILERKNDIGTKEAPTKPRPTIEPKPDVDDPDFDPFIDPDPSDDPEARNPLEAPTKPKPTTEPKPDVDDPDFDPFIDPDPSDDPEAESDDFDYFMRQVRKYGKYKR